MKTLAFIAFSVITSAAMAQSFGGGGGYGGGGGSGGGTPVASPQISIDGTSVQLAVMTGTTVRNDAAAGSEAFQNLASNSGDVSVDTGGLSIQAVVSRNSSVANYAVGNDAYASQNLSSNVGGVTVSGDSLQLTLLNESGVVNVAAANAKAVQNIASNNACFTCQPTHRGN